MLINKQEQNIDSFATDIIEDLFTRMLRIRLFEECVVDLLYKKDIRCPVHLYVGQEAISAGVCANLNDKDYVFSTHRSHGHYIAKGGSLNALMAELYGKESGCSHGKGGSMHLVEPEIGYMGSSAIVAGSIPIAVGASFSALHNGNKQISVAFFGDGAMDEGVSYESLNLASLYNLPMVFICENNLFSTHLPVFKRHNNQNLFEKARVFNIKAIRIDGNNPFEVYTTANECIENVRKGNGPVFIECMTFRWLAHVGPTPDLDIGYRKKKDVEFWMERCPIKAIKHILEKRPDWEKGKTEAIENKIRIEVQESLKYARQSSYPSVNEINKGIFSEKTEGK